MTENSKSIGSEPGPDDNDSDYKVDFKPWLDELLSDADEAKYSSWIFAKDLMLIRGLAKIALSLIFLLIIISLFFEVNSSNQYTFIARVVSLFFFMSVHLLLKKPRVIEKARSIILYAIIGTMCINMLVILSFPVNLFAYIGFDITIIFICYLAVPISMKSKITINLAYSTLLLLILFIYKEPLYQQTYNNFITSIIFANIFAYWMAIQLGRSRRLNYQLMINEREAKKEIHQLQGIIPICSYCKNIRDDGGSWDLLEAYICAHSEAKFSHGICPHCLEIELEKSKRKK